MCEGRAGEALRPQRGALRPRTEVRLEAAFTPAGLLILCRGDAANPTASAVSTCDRRITTPTTIHVAAGHMHLLGASIRLELNPGTSRAKVLLDIPRWDFHWQNAYTLARAVKAEPGDVVRVTCRHDVRKRLHGGHGVSDDAALRPLGRGDDRRDVPRDPPGDARVAHLRILLVSQMYPGPDDPDLGVFVANLERELLARGHEIERAVVDSRDREAAATRRSVSRRSPCRTPLPSRRRLRALPRPRRPRRRARDARTARRHRSRPGRREHRLEARRPCRDPARRAESSDGDRRLAVAPRSTRGSRARRARQDRGDRLRRRPRALRAARRRDRPS